MKNSDLFAYILVKPDIFIRGKCKHLLEIIENNKLKIIAFKFMRLSNELYQLMYMEQFKSELDFWSHNKKAYRFGPVLGLLCMGNKGNDSPNNLQKFIKTIQGSAIPELLSYNSLRYQLEAKSRVFNCIHVPDDHEQSFKEAHLFFGKEYLTNSLKYKKTYSLGQIMNNLENQGYFLYHHLDPKKVFLHIKSRILHSLSRENICTLALKNKIDKVLNTKYKNIEQINHNELLNEFAEHPLINHFKSIFRNIEGKKQIHSSLEFFWGMLKTSSIFYLPIEKYLIVTGTIYH